MDIQGAIESLSRGQELLAEQAESVMTQIMRGEATEAQIGAYLMGLRIKGESVDEIAGSAQAMRAAAHQVPTAVDVDLLDTCGTGGDASGTFNISTTVAFVAAGAGIPVAKHGNRAASSKCGSADVLAELGVNLDLSPEQVGRCIDEVGIGFLFAVKLHPAMRFAIGPRRQMGIRTIFNVLGPMTNPAGAQRQLIGVFAPELTEVMTRVLKALGSKSAMVVHGHGGLDELTTTGPNQISFLRDDGSIERTTLDATELGFEVAEISDLRGDDAPTNAAILRGVLSGEICDARRDVVALNAGAAIVAAGRADSILDGITLAKQAIDDGGALAKLEQLIELSRKLAA